ncbi:MAG: ArnT family glycosyltransferase [Cyclobacteriaceae bacterium]
MSIRSFTKHPVFLLILLGVASFFPFLGTTHLFDWDEINFAESAREMMITGEYLKVQINYEPFWEKPPLFFWLQVISMKVFGVGAFAARFPNAVMGIVTMITIYLLGRREHNQTFGLIWSLLYVGSLLPHLYYRSGIIDPVFNFFIFLGVYYLYITVVSYSKSILFASLSGLFTGLSVLTKGPVGLLLVLLTLFTIWSTRRFSRSIVHYQEVVIFVLTALLVSFFWFGWETIQHGPRYLVEFIAYQVNLFTKPVAGHAQPWYYHALVVFIGCFPISIFGLKRLFGTSNLSDFDRWMLALFWAVMILFSCVTTKIVHYSSMTYLPLSFLAAREVYSWHQTGVTKSTMALYMVFGCTWSLLLAALGYLLNDIDLLGSMLQGEFAIESLKVELDLLGWEWAIGILFFMATIFICKLLLKKQFLKMVWAQAMVMSVMLTFVSATLLPNIEALSQRPAINFFKSYKGKDVYLMTEGHKSYATYFYGEVQRHENEHALEEKWLLSGPIDKPVYIAVKINNVDSMEQYPDIVELYRKGGFVFFERLPQKIPESEALKS